MAWIKILIFFLCSFQVCFTEFDKGDFELCLEFELQGKSINGVNIKPGFFKIEFKQFEEKVPALTTEEFYKSFKRYFGNYSEIGNLQKRIIRNFIHKEMSKNLMVIMYFMSATLFSQITSKFELYMCAHRISKSVFFFLQVPSNEDVKYFLRNATDYMNLVDFNVMPSMQGFSNLLVLAQVSFGTLQVEDQRMLESIGVTKLHRIVGNLSISTVYYNVYFPVKFDQSLCTKKIAEADLPIFYSEVISAFMSAQPKLRNVKK